MEDADNTHVPNAASDSEDKSFHLSDAHESNNFAPNTPSKNNEYAVSESDE